MGRKPNTNKNENRKGYPIKVRLVKPNPTNENVIMFNGIELCTYKDTEIPDLETLMKVQPMYRYLIIKPNQNQNEIDVESETEIETEIVEDEKIEDMNGDK